MNSGPPTNYERLTPDQAAHIDAACDCFEQAWKAVPDGGTVPCIASFLECRDEPERAILATELHALEQACRERYGLPVQPDGPPARGIAVEGAALSATRSRRPSAAVPLAALPVASIGRFILQRELGRGGMGIVYLAYDPQLRREVALKVLHGQKLADAPSRARFQGEARAAAGLHHPNVVPVYETGEVDSVAFIVLAYCPGITLAEWIQQRSEPVPCADAVQLVATLAEAVEHAHQHGVVHRDLKPANVLLSELSAAAVPSAGPYSGSRAPASLSLADYHPRITDFGLAKHRDATTSHTQTGTIIGTPCYMAPEQTGTMTNSTGPATDVYALGGLLYELLTGRAPFQGETALDTLVQVRNLEPISPRNLRPRLPRDLETICLKCLDKDPRRRYASARELGAELGRFLQGHPIHARPQGAWGRLAKRARRRPAIAGLLAALVAVTVTGFTGILVKYREAEEERGRAQQEGLAKTQALEIASAERYKALQSAAQARGDQLRAEVARYGLQTTLVQREWQNENLPGAREYLAATATMLRGWEYGYLSRLCNPTALTLSGLERPRRVASSPDGNLLAAFGTGRTAGPRSGVVHVWDAQSGRLLQTLGDLPDPHYAVRFNARGMLVLEGNNNDIVAAANALTFSPDGRWLAAACTPEPVVHIWDTDTWQQRFTLKGHITPIHCITFSPDKKVLATGSADGVIKLWDVASGKEVKEFLGFKSPITCLVFDAGGQRLVGGIDGYPAVGKVWTVTTGDLVCTLKGLVEPRDAMFGPNDTLYTVCRDRDVQTWNCKTGIELRSIRLSSQGTRTPFVRAQFHPDGQRLTSVSSEPVIEVWRLPDGEQQLSLKGHAKTILDIAPVRGGQQLASAGLDNTVRVWPLAHPVAETLRAHDGAYGLQLRFLPTGNRLLSVSGDGRGLLWDFQQRKGMTWLKGHTSGITGAACHPNGQLLVTAAANIPGKQAGDLRFWDSSGKELRVVREPHTQSLTSVAFRADGGLLALASHEAVVYLCDPDKGGVEQILRGHQGPVQCVVFAPAGARLATAGADQTVRLWDSITGRLLQTFRGHAGPVLSVAFSPDGTRLASAGADRTIKLWDVAPTATGSDALLATLPGHVDVVTSVAFHRDGQRLASGSHDGAVRVWDVQTGQEVLCLRGHTGHVLGVAFSPDGRWLASGAEDGVIRLWDGVGH